MTPLLAIKSRPLIYAIQNTVSGKIYVGKTKCIYRRCHQYLYAFRSNNVSKYINDYLYNSFAKYGIDKFVMYPLEFTTVENLAERELHWMVQLQTTNRDFGYNLMMESGGSIVVHDDTRSKIRENLKRQWASGSRDGHSEKMKKSWENRDTTFQSNLFRKSLTKYNYNVTSPDGSTLTVKYKELYDMGLASVLTKFHKHKTDKSTCKGYTIERIRLDEDKA